MKSGGTTPSDASWRKRSASSVKVAGELLEPGEIMIRVLAVADRMLGVEEVGHAVISAAELAQHIGRRPAAGIAVGEAGAVGIHAPAKLGNVVVERAGLARARSRPNACSCRCRSTALARSRLRFRERLVAELAAKISEVAGVEAEVGGESRILDQILAEPGVEHGAERPVATGLAGARWRLGCAAGASPLKPRKASAVELARKVRRSSKAFSMNRNSAC